MSASISRIHTFWRWFSSVSNELASDLNDEQIHRDLDRKLASFGELTWELGPGESADNFLAVSPGGKASLLSLSEEIVAHAPALKGWEFLAAKPKREGFFEFDLELESGRSVEINASIWRYVLFRSDDHTVDVLIEQPELKDAIEQSDGYDAAIVALDALLGEKCRICCIADVAVVVCLTSVQSFKSNRFQHLPGHLESLGLVPSRGCRSLN